MSISEDFTNQFLTFAGQAQINVEMVQNWAHRAIQIASKSEAPEELNLIFKKFASRFERWSGSTPHVSDQIHGLINNEMNRIAEVWKKRPRTEQAEVHPEEYTEHQAKRARTEPSAQAAEEVQQPETESLVHISDLPETAFKEIFALLPKSDKKAFLDALASRQTKEARDILFEEIIPQCRAIWSDPEAHRLFKLVYGRGLTLPERLKEREDAKARRDMATVHQINEGMTEAYKKMLFVKEDFEALPENVRKMFSDVDSSKILSDPTCFKSALIAIRASNLVAILDGVDTVPRNLDVSTREKLISSGELIAKVLTSKEAIDSYTEEFFVEAVTCTTLPLELMGLTNLKQLIITKSRVARIPPQIGKLRNLQVLYLCDNEIQSLPPEIGMLSHLKYIGLSDNYLKTLPPEIGDLEQLRGLSIGANLLPSLPPELGNLENCTIEINDNPIHSLPQSIRRNTTLTIKD